jgi:ABC-type multidrug transport system fused ATPase/permease subunit
VAVISSVLLALRILNGDHPAMIVMMGCCLVIIYRGLETLECRHELASEGGVKAEEIAAYINRIPSVSQAPGAGFLQPMSRTLTFNQIFFQTSQLPGLLRGLDLRISFGERIAILSLQQAATHALASMIPRFLDPDLGQVLIDGRDIREATLESLRAEAIFVGGQDPVFNATVVENITCGQADITRQQALDAAKLVHADHFIRTLPRGYETILGEHGAALDAGQVFRLSLARAVVRSPAILIIEEPPVSLDTETKTMLDDAYQRICQNRTVIFLPHRLSTVKKCSRIVLIHEGRVAVDGVHDQLVRTSDLYRHWEYVRFNPFREDVD